MNLLMVARHSPLVVPLACVAAVAIMFLSEGSYWKASSTLKEMAAMTEVRTSIRQLQMSLLEAETGQRGYLLTADKDYLLPYVQALATSDQSFKLLAQTYGQDLEFSALLKRLNQQLVAKKAELALTISLFDAGRRDEATQLILSHSGKHYMDAFRIDIEQLLRLETERSGVQRALLHQTLMISRIGLAALCAISLLALFLYLRQTLTLKQQQLDLKRTLQVDRDQLFAEASTRTVQLTELTQHLLTAREDERGRLARNLHDELGALLTSAKLDAARIKSRLASMVPAAPEAQERLAHLVGTLNASIALGRSIIEDLRPSTLNNLGLVPTLEILVREFAEAKDLRVHCELQPVKLAAGTEIVVYRVVQEAITNISKYAQAGQIWVDMKQAAGLVTVSVRDDGVGFDSAAAPRSAYGLLGMRVRAEAEGGQLTVSSRPGQGTLIQLSLPVQGGNSGG
jgi:signal transduction histidine kinase